MTYSLNANTTSTRVLVAALIVALALLAGCGKTDQQTQPVRIPAVPVTVGTAVLKTVPIEITAIGNVEAYSTVAVKAQLSGPIATINFNEGQNVTKGQVLFTIDPAPFEAALQRAEASLHRSEANQLRDQALLNNAEQDVKRYTELVEKEYVTRQQYDAVLANAEAMRATIKADEAGIRADAAAMRSAQLDLNYCTVTSPIDARTGELLIHQGNIVRANDTTVINLSQIRPIYVNFAVPEPRLSEIKQHMAAGQLTLTTTPPNSTDPPETGHLSFLDSSVESGTGTIHLKGVFDNVKNRLWPGQFVTVRLVLDTRSDALMVPTPAVQTNQEGQFVFLVRPGMTVESRQIEIGEAFNGETIVEKGLEPGDKVVTDGQLRLLNGSTVIIREGIVPGARKQQ